jgi:hypothetical protein
MRYKRIAALLTGVGILLRVIPFWSMPTWYDENYTWLVAKLPLDRLLQATAGDVHPPLWYLIIYPIARIPNMPVWLGLRLPALVAGLLSIWVFWKIINKMRPTYNNYGDGYRDRVILVAFGLFCLMPQQVYYSQEGRMYSLLTLLVLLCWLCILNQKWVALGITAAAMLWLHNYGMFYLVSLWVAGLVYDRWHWKHITISLLLAGLSFIPWVIILLRQMATIGGNYWIVNFNWASVIGDLAHTYFGVVYINFEMINIVVFVGLLTWSLIWSIRSRELDIPAAILAFGPLVLAAVVSALWNPVMLFRALTPSAAFICFILADPLEYLDNKKYLLIAIFFIPALLVNLSNVVFRSGWASANITNQDTMITILDQQWRDGDLLYYVDDGTYITGAVYWSKVNNILEADQCGPVRGGLSPITKQALGIKTGPLPQNVTGRIWAISGQTPLNPICLDQYLKDNGLLDGSPIYCAQDNRLVKSCLYLVDQ